MMKNKILLGTLLLLLFIPSFALAQEEAPDIEVFGLELEKLLNLGSGLLAVGLFVITSLGYKRTKNKRLLFVSIAFALFAIKSLSMGAEILFGEWPWVDPVTSILDFAILLSFFAGLLKK